MSHERQKSWSLLVCKITLWTAKNWCCTKEWSDGGFPCLPAITSTQGFTAGAQASCVPLVPLLVTQPEQSTVAEVSPVQPPPPEQSSTVNEMVPDFGELKKKALRAKRRYDRQYRSQRRRRLQLCVESCCHFLPLRSLQYLDVFYTSARWFSNESNRYGNKYWNCTSEKPQTKASHWKLEKKQIKKLLQGIFLPERWQWPKTCLCYAYGKLFHVLMTCCTQKLQRTLLLVWDLNNLFAWSLVLVVVLNSKSYGNLQTLDLTPLCNNTCIMYIRSRCGRHNPSYGKRNRFSRSS